MWDSQTPEEREPMICYLCGQKSTEPPRSFLAGGFTFISDEIQVCGECYMGLYPNGPRTTPEHVQQHIAAHPDMAAKLHEIIKAQKRGQREFQQSLVADLGLN